MNSLSHLNAKLAFSLLVGTTITIAACSFAQAQTSRQYAADVDKYAGQLNLSGSDTALIKQVLQNAPSNTYAKTTTSKSPPTGFPAPLYRGTQTTYMSMPAPGSSEESVTLTTTDALATVAAWYRQALVQQGWKIVDSSTGWPVNLPGSSQNLPQVFTAEKSNLICRVSITPTGQTSRTNPTAPQTCVKVQVAKNLPGQ